MAARDTRAREGRNEDALKQVFRFQAEQHEAFKLIELSAGTVFYVKSGRVLVTAVDQSGHETLCVLREAGTMMGLESLVGMKVPLFVWTLTEAELLIAPIESIRKWLDNNPHPSQVLLQEGLEASRVQLTERMALQAPAAARLARVLMAAIEGGALDAGQRRKEALLLSLPKNVIARMLHMRPETLSRVLRKLEQAGAIRLDPELEVIDLPRLRDLSNTTERGAF